MVSRFLRKLVGGGSKPGAEQPKSKIPPGKRIYAIGDIHGRFDLLQELHDVIAEDRAQKPLDDTVVYLGDYIDRGMESRQVIDFLLASRTRDAKCVFLLGNHEAMLLNFHQRTRGANAWLNNGGIETLHSYGVPPPKISEGEAGLNRAWNEFRRRLPEQHLSFYHSLSWSFEMGDYFFVHAGVRPGCALEQQTKEDMIWIRDLFLDSNEQFSKIIVHGHSIRAQVEERANRIGIDTGAYMSGTLTALVLEGEERRYLST